MSLRVSLSCGVCACVLCMPLPLRCPGTHSSWLNRFTPFFAPLTEAPTKKIACRKYGAILFADVPNLLLFDVACVEHSQHLIVMNGLQLVDRLLGSFANRSLGHLYERGSLCGPKAVYGRCAHFRTESAMESVQKIFQDVAAQNGVLLMGRNSVSCWQDVAGYWRCFWIFWKCNPKALLQRRQPWLAPRWLVEKRSRRTTLLRTWILIALRYRQSKSIKSSCRSGVSVQWRSFEMLCFQLLSGSWIVQEVHWDTCQMCWKLHSEDVSANGMHLAQLATGKGRDLRGVWANSRRSIKRPNRCLLFRSAFSNQAKI